MVDGTTRSVTLRGVGCPSSMCSRVRARDIKADSLWLDGLASVREISHEADGPVKAMFKFRDGAEREVSIVATNRVLYIASWFGLTEKLDLGRASKIAFEYRRRAVLPDPTPLLEHPALQLSDSLLRAFPVWLSTILDK